MNVVTTAMAHYVDYVDENDVIVMCPYFLSRCCEHQEQLLISLVNELKPKLKSMKIGFKQFMYNEPYYGDVAWDVPWAMNRVVDAEAGCSASFEELLSAQTAMCIKREQEEELNYLKSKILMQDSILHNTKSIVQFHLCDYTKIATYKRLYNINKAKTLSDFM